MTAPSPSRPDPSSVADLLADLDQTTVGPPTPEQAVAHALDRPIADRTRKPPRIVPRADRRSAPDRRSGRSFGPSPRQYNRHR